MHTLQIRVDDDLKARAQAVADNLGLDLTSAIRVFLKQFVRENGFPFMLKADLFYSREHLAQLDRRAQEMDIQRKSDYVVVLEKADRIIEKENIIRLNRQEQQRLAQALAGENTPELSDFVQQVAKEYRERVSP